MPDSTKVAQIDGNCSLANPVVIASGSNTAQRLNMATTAGAAGYLKLTGGSLTNTTTSAECNVGNAGTGWLHVAGGTLYVPYNLNIGYGSGSEGTCLMESGNLRFKTLYVGRSGSGTLIQTGGTNTTYGSGGSDNIYIGAVEGGYGVAIVSNGVFGASGYNVYVGASGAGELYLRGGSMYLSRHMYIGNASTGDGYVSLEGGTLTVNYDLHIGAAGKGAMEVSSTTGTCRGLYLGENAGGSGTLTMLSGGKITLGTSYVTEVGSIGTGVLHLRGGEVDGTGNNSDLAVRVSEGAVGVVRGWGSHSGNRQIRNNGLIIADGEGQERDLDLTTFDGYQSATAWTNTIENATTNGWYAANKGRLRLCPRTIATGNGVVLNWAEGPEDTEIDLVNSLRFTFASVTTAGALTNSLLAADRSDVPAPPSGKALIGVWNCTFAGAFTTLDLEARYDHVAAGGAAVSLLRYNTGTSTWDVLSDTVLSGYRLSATGVTSGGASKVGLIAVACQLPPARTVVLLR